MSALMEDEIKRWTARRKAALVLEIIQGRPRLAEASRAHDLPPSEIELWVEDGKKAWRTPFVPALRMSVREAAEGLAGSVRRSDVGASRQKRIAVPAGRGRQVIETIRQGLKEGGYTVSISKLCRWFEVPRRTVYYRPSRKQPLLQERFVQPIKQMIEENPSSGYRTVAYLLKLNKNTVQRIFQLKPKSSNSEEILPIASRNQSREIRSALCADELVLSVRSPSS